MLTAGATAQQGYDQYGQSYGQQSQGHSSSSYGQQYAQPPGWLRTISVHFWVHVVVSRLCFHPFQGLNLLDCSGRQSLELCSRYAASRVNRCLNNNFGFSTVCHPRKLLSCRYSFASLHLHGTISSTKKYKKKEKKCKGEHLPAFWVVTHLFSTLLVAYRRTNSAEKARPLL